MLIYYIPYFSYCQPIIEIYFIKERAAKMDATILRDRIYELCNEKNILITELESQIGISQGCISLWIKSPPNINKVYIAAQILGVSTDYLVGNSNIRQKTDEVLDDPAIISIQRARQKMSSEEKQKMMHLLKLSFEEEFKESTDDT